MTVSIDSRHFVPELTAELERLDDGRVVLLAPAPGLWRDAPAPGALLRPHDVIGSIEILGVAHRLRAPEQAVGIVVDAGQHAALARRAVDYRAPLLTLDPEALGASLAAEAAAADTPLAADGSVAFKTSSSGRFYRRPAPDKPNFVEVGQVIERGQTLGLLEVMKTFTRINYDDPKLPAPARIVALVAEDQADLDAGDLLLLLEPLSPS
jgi:acetyl-CoA carboxylase biotin carboxyl carrier protein